MEHLQPGHSVSFFPPTCPSSSAMRVLASAPSCGACNTRRRQRRSPSRYRSGFACPRALSHPAARCQPGLPAMTGPGPGHASCGSCSGLLAFCPAYRFHRLRHRCCCMHRCCHRRNYQSCLHRTRWLHQALAVRQRHQGRPHGGRRRRPPAGATRPGARPTPKPPPPGRTAGPRRPPVVQPQKTILGCCGKAA